jgi:serine/threonine-protein phosphatase 2A regulatory subunit A
MAIIECIPVLASQVGVEFFDEKMGAMCLSWLQDCVFTIREAAIANIKKLIQMFGIEWAQQRLISKALDGHTHDSYLYRMTTLYAVSSLADVVGPDSLKGTMLPMVLRLAADPVPNVRFNAAKTLRNIVPLLDTAAVEEHVKPCLVTLSEDSDADVSYFASQGLQSC